MKNQAVVEPSEPSAKALSPPICSDVVAEIGLDARRGEVLPERQSCRLADADRQPALMQQLLVDAQGVSGVVIMSCTLVTPFSAAYFSAASTAGS